MVPALKSEQPVWPNRQRTEGSDLDRSEKLNRDLISKLILMEKVVRQQEVQVDRRRRLQTRADLGRPIPDSSSIKRDLHRLKRVSLNRGLESPTKQPNPAINKFGSRLVDKRIFELPFLQIRRGLANRSLDSYEQKLKDSLSRSFLGIDKNNIAIIKMKEPKFKLGIKKLSDDSAANLSIDKDVSQDLQTFIRTAYRFSKGHKASNPSTKQTDACKQLLSHKRDGLRSVLGSGTPEHYSASQFAVNVLTLNVSSMKKPQDPPAKDRKQLESRRPTRDLNPKPRPATKSTDQPASIKLFTSIKSSCIEAKDSIDRSQLLSKPPATHKQLPDLSTSTVDLRGAPLAVAAGKSRPAGLIRGIQPRSVHERLDSQLFGDCNFTLCSWKAETSQDDSFRATEDI